MTMRDIPRAEWDTFLDRFSREHRSQPVTVAKSDARHDRAAHRITITVAEPPSGEVTHTVVEPDSVALEEPAETDEDPQVVVHLTGGGQHWALRREREPHHRDT